MSVTIGKYTVTVHPMDGVGIWWLIPEGSINVCVSHNDFGPSYQRHEIYIIDASKGISESVALAPATFKSVADQTAAEHLVVSLLNEDDLLGTGHAINNHFFIQG